MANNHGIDLDVVASLSILHNLVGVWNLSISIGLDIGQLIDISCVLIQMKYILEQPVAECSR